MGVSKYTDYSRESLIQRINELESQVQSPSKSQPPRSVSPKQKIRKPFNRAKYNTRHIALKFAYLGQNYCGLEHHANNPTPLPTIEEVLWKALIKTRLIFPEGDDSKVNWEGTEYTKCGRTDRGVSAFGQVIGLRVRSNRPKDHTDSGTDWREIDYIHTINRVLPSDIRALAWCPNPPTNGDEPFSARFACRERQYRYFFTNPPYAGSEPLDIEAMRLAAEKLVGEHDFRNFCKVDPSKQITNFRRNIFCAEIHTLHSAVGGEQIFYFKVHGSAFLWHQVRHLVAILFLVGQGRESPDVVDSLLDTERCPGKPIYEMADDMPLVLWDCVFRTGSQPNGDTTHADGIEWVTQTGAEPYSTHGVLTELWALWQRRKIDELLAHSLMRLVEGELVASPANDEGSDRVFDGSERPQTVGKYVPIMQRARTEAPETVNARYAQRKGLHHGS
ncbi:tRNA pseudouridine synthase [Piedraia hortae CBS 480.64]|uniref:tRNA pseudouridine synthase n=1 Tax=Piedraia hortae CBS 480.64 TaxID=1314780 RepID=A0A6A7CD87_9PEZI|nr:tRNA pseudouridine synthase [Piedraia hortae CBS 480.64]